MNIYELRILLKCVELAQCELQQFIISRQMYRKSHSLEGREVRIPVRELLPPGSHHYEQIRVAARNLVTKKIEAYDSTSSTWQCASLVAHVKQVQGEGELVLSIHPWVWDCILDFTKGYVKYDLGVAMRMPSPAALRLFFIVSGQKRKLRYSVKELKAMLGVSDKYQNNSDFIRKVIEPSVKMLSDLSPWACTYSVIRENKRINSLLIFPFEQVEKYSPTIYEKKLVAKSGGVFGCHNLYQYLRYNVGFSHKELCRNKKLLEEFSERCPDAVGFVAQVKHRSLKSQREFGKGYYINAMRAELAKHRDN